MSIDIDELQAKWASYDRRVEESIGLSRRLLSELTASRARPPLRSLRFALVVELVATFAVIVALGSFIYANVGALRFAVPAAALDLYSIVYFQGLIRQFVAIGGIDAADSVTAVQTKFAELRLLRLRYTKLTFLAVALAWTPLLIVGMKALGLDAYALLGTPYLVANVLFGLAVIPLALWVARTFGSHLEQFGLVRGLVQSLEGHNLAQTASFLGSLKEFQAD